MLTTGPREQRCGSPPAVTGRAQNYQEAIRIAEEREKKLREVFDRCDDNRSGSIDMEEILPVLDDLGLARRLKSDRIEFAARVFLSYDVDGSGELRYRHAVNRDP